LTNKLHFLPDLLNGHYQDDVALADTSPPLLHKMILILLEVVLMIIAQMITLNHHQFHLHHVDVLHPLHHLPLAVNSEQNMTLRWLVAAWNTPLKRLILVLGLQKLR
jgi:hypothetical protein